MYMKKLFVILLIIAPFVKTLAQTDFRQLSFEEAISAAKAENKLVFIDFYTDWCGPCRTMSRQVFPQKSVGDYLNNKFVCIKLNAEKEGVNLAKRYGIKAYPTFLILNTKEEVQFDIRGSMDAEAFINKVNSYLDPESAPLRMEQRYNAGERTPKLINQYALYLMEQNKEEEGFKVINDYYNSLSDAQKLKDENSFLFLRYTLDLDDSKSRFMIDHLHNFSAALSSSIHTKVSQLYHTALVGYLSGYMFEDNRYNPKVYDSLKQEILRMKLDKEYPYTPLFKLIESYSQHNLKAYLIVCESEFKDLSSTDKDLLILNMARLIKTDDKETLKICSCFIRSHLSELGTSAISLAGRTLENIETKM